MKFNIRILYLYLFSAIGLFICIIGLIRLIDLGMKVYIFHDADKYTFTRPVLAPEKTTGQNSGVSEEELKRQNDEAEKAQEMENKRNRQRETSGALAMILIGIPVYLYHWNTIAKENKSKK